MEYDFEGVIENLLKQQGKTKKSLYEYLGLTRQGFDNKLKNQTVSVLELSTIARYFDTTETNLIAVLANKTTLDEPTPKKDGNYLQEHITNLEGSFKRLSERFDSELSAKNQQIAGLQRMLESVLGKSKGVSMKGRATNLKPVTVSMATNGRSSYWGSGVQFGVHLPLE